MACRLLALFLMIFVLAACAVGPVRRPEPADGTLPPDSLTTVVAPPPGHERAPFQKERMPYPAMQAPSAVLATFVRTLDGGRSSEAWQYLSTDTRRWAGGSAESFAREEFGRMRDRFGGWLGYRLVLNERPGEDLAVVSIAGERNGLMNQVLAVAVVQEQGRWRLSLAPPDRSEIALRLSAGEGGLLLHTGLAHPVLAWLGQDQVTIRTGESGSQIALPADVRPGGEALTIMTRGVGSPPVAYGFWLKP